VLFAASIVWMASPNFTTSVGTFFTSTSDRLAVGSTSIANGQSFSGVITNTDSGRINNLATTAVLIYPKNNEAVREYNRTVRVELEAVREGYTSWQKWNHSATRPEVAPPEQPINLLLAHMTAGTATLTGITASIDAQGVLTLNGTVSANINIKYTGGIAIDASRPSAWDSDSALYEGTTALTLAVSVVGGSYTIPEGVTDCFNITARYSTASIFLNAKLGDGIASVTGTPSASVRMGIVYLRAGVVLNNVQLQITLHEGV
jgi:hypothetical protein